MHVAYVHCRPDGTPFYVGKGSVGRALFVSRKHNQHYQNIVNKHGKDNILVGMLECSSEDIAFELEKGLIKCLTRMGIRLTNMNEGGKGGYRPCEETKAKKAEKQAFSYATTDRAIRHSETMKCKFDNEEFRKKFGNSMKQVAEKPEWRAKVADATKEALSNISDEAKQRRADAISKRNKAIWDDPDKRAELCTKIRGPKQVSELDRVKRSVNMSTIVAKRDGRDFCPVSFKR